MNKIKTKQIDGYQIVTGIAPMSIDPEATRMVANPVLIKTPEALALADEAKKKGNHFKAAGQAGKHAMHADKCGTEEVAKPVRDPENPQHALLRSDQFHDPVKLKKLQADFNRYEKQRTDNLGAAGLCNENLKVMAAAVRKIGTDHKRANPVFNEPNAGEYIDRGLLVVGPDSEGRAAIFTEIELEELGVFLPGGQTVSDVMGLHLACGENRKLQASGEYVNDYRGCKYYFHDGAAWVESETITELGVDVNTVVVDEYQDVAIEAGDRTSEQVEEWRFQNLTESDKTAEYEAAKVALLNQAIAMRSGLEIEGATATVAKTQSTAWYDAELAILKTKYGVTDA